MLKSLQTRAAHHDLLRHVAESTRSYASTTSTTSVIPTLSRPKTIFSGIQPTGVPHLGNYLGALQQWKKLQDEAADDTKLIYSIVDLHAITVPQQANDLRKCKREMLATLLAIGLDPERSTIFMQSSVSIQTSHADNIVRTAHQTRSLNIRSSCGFSAVKHQLVTSLV